MSAEQNAGGADSVVINPAAFQDLPLGKVGSHAEAAVSNLDLVLDVAVPVTVSVGSVRKTISEILSLVPGQVIDLERAAGEPVDLFVNERLIARGEIVVVGERYGFRVTEIVAAGDGIESMLRH